MKSPKILLLAIIAALSPQAASGVDYPQIGRLQVEAEKYISSLKPDDRSRIGAPSLRGYIFQAGADLSQGNLDAADQGLRQLRQLLPTAGAQSLIEELAASLRIARESRDAAAAQTAQALADRVAQTCLSATTIEEFDPLLKELAEARTAVSRNNNTSVLQLAAQKLDTAIHYARRWQDYVDKRNSGDERGALQIMTELSNNTQLLPILPRSELLKRSRAVVIQEKQEETPAVGIQLADFKPASLADIPATLERLRPHLASRRTVSEEVRTFAQHLRSLQSGAKAAALGDYGRALQIAGSLSYNSPEADDLLIKLRHELIFQVLPRQLELSKDLAPAGDTNPTDYLLRVIAAAKEKNDWLLVLRAYDSLVNTAYANGRVPDWVQQDRTAIGFYIAGLNHEKAGDKQSALNAYGSALKMPSKILPVDEVAQRIKTLNGSR